MSATTPERVDQLFAQAINDGDLDTVLDLYELDAPLAAHTGDILAEPAARRAYVEEFLAMGAKMAIETAKIVRRDDLALMFSPWTVSCTAPDGTPMTMAGNSVVVLRRQADGTWRFAIDDPGWIAG